MIGPRLLSCSVPHPPGVDNPHFDRLTEAGGRRATAFTLRASVRRLRPRACVFGHRLDAGQAHTYSVGITVYYVPGERMLAAIRELFGSRKFTLAVPGDT